MDKDTRFRALLDQTDDLLLFGQGGCFYFARTLHEMFGYRLVWIPGHPELAQQGVLQVSHVFCLIVDGQEYGVDAWGTQPAAAIVDHFGAIGATLTTLTELMEWRKDARRGIFAESWFEEGAVTRARARIERFRPYFDGTIRAKIPAQV